MAEGTRAAHRRNESDVDKVRRGLEMREQGIGIQEVLKELEIGQTKYYRFE